MLISDDYGDVADIFIYHYHDSNVMHLIHQ